MYKFKGIFRIEKQGVTVIEFKGDYKNFIDANNRLKEKYDYVYLTTSPNELIFKKKGSNEAVLIKIPETEKMALLLNKSVGFYTLNFNDYKSNNSPKMQRIIKMLGGHTSHRVIAYGYDPINNWIIFQVATHTGPKWYKDGVKELQLTEEDMTFGDGGILPIMIALPIDEVDSLVKLGSLSKNLMADYFKYKEERSFIQENNKTILLFNPLAVKNKGELTYLILNNSSIIKFKEELQLLTILKALGKEISIIEALNNDSWVARNEEDQAKEIALIEKKSDFYTYEEKEKTSITTYYLPEKNLKTLNKTNEEKNKLLLLADNADRRLDVEIGKGNQNIE